MCRVAHVVLHATAADLYDVVGGTSSLGDSWASFLGIAMDVARDSTCGKGHCVGDR